MINMSSAREIDQSDAIGVVEEEEVEDEALGCSCFMHAANKPARIFNSHNKSNCNLSTEIQSLFL